MDYSKEEHGLLKLLDRELDIDHNLVLRKTVDFLLSEGFTKTSFKDEAEASTYILEDLQDLNHLGKSYEFCLHQNMDKYRFTRKMGNGKIKVYQGVEAVRALVKTMKIRNSIIDAEKKGLYEISEHLTGEIDFDRFEN